MFCKSFREETNEQLHFGLVCESFFFFPFMRTIRYVPGDMVRAVVFVIDGDLTCLLADAAKETS